MSSKQPLISVTLPNYNYGRFLTESLQSVLNQTYENFEILFVDDGSTDESREIAERFVAALPVPACRRIGWKRAGTRCR